MAYYIGLMSGTSADGIDAALVHCDIDAGVKLQAHRTLAFDGDLQEQIHALCAAGDNEIERAGALGVTLGELFAQTVLELLAQTGLSARDIHAIGSHGQTIRHRPPGQAPHPFSWQIGDPNIIAARTGITTVADFRRRDMALGGQGAPLVPAFHAAVFEHAQRNRAIVNIGGIANISWLQPHSAPLGFDTGPGNCLMDGWIHRHRGKHFDSDGAWAHSGKVHNALLERLLAHPYLTLPAPKSTGREDFHLSWLDEQLTALAAIAPADVQATLLAFTVETIARHAQGCPSAKPGDELYVCGGGAANNTLMKALTQRLKGWHVDTTAALGVEPNWVEATAFAWLAAQTMAKRPGNMPSVTGASHTTVLGGIYPAA